MILLANMFSYVMFFAGVALLIFTLMRRHIRRQKLVTKEAKKYEKQALVNTRPVASKDVGLLDAPDEITRWEVALHDTARELKAELDSKIRVVQTLVLMAQQETKRLEEAIDEARRLGVVIDPKADPIERIENLADRLLDMGQRPPTDSSQPQQDAQPEQDSPTSPLPLDATALAQVASLRKQGMSPFQIAERLKRPIADIELMLQADSTSN